MLVPLLDRFASPSPDPAACLARDIADVLGGRRIFHGRDLGVLSWGLPHMSQVTSRSSDSKLFVAARIAETLAQFEPRLEDVDIVPIEGTADFAFRIKARYGASVSESVSLELLSPFLGGSLGADVDVVDFSSPVGSDS